MAYSSELGSSSEVTLGMFISSKLNKIVIIDQVPPLRLATFLFILCIHPTQIVSFCYWFSDRVSVHEVKSLGGHF